MLTHARPADADRHAAIVRAFPGASILGASTGRVGVIVVRLGNGAEVVVKLGWDAVHDRELAIEAAVLREAEAIAGIPHLRDETTIDGRRALMIERVRGRTLAEHLAPGGAPDHEDFAALGRVATALHHVHERGWVHGDVKLDNIMVDGADGHLVDFALARRVGTPITGPQTVSIPNLPPEVCQGGAVFDEAFDLYALGVVVYETACRSHPYRLASSPREQFEYANRPVPVAVWRPDLSPSACSLVDSLVSPHRGDRPSTGRELASRLETLASS